MQLRIFDNLIPDIFKLNNSLHNCFIELINKYVDKQ